MLTRRERRATVSVGRKKHSGVPGRKMRSCNFAPHIRLVRYFAGHRTSLECEDAREQDEDDVSTLKKKKTGKADPRLHAVHAQADAGHAIVSAQADVSAYSPDVHAYPGPCWCICYVTWVHTILTYVHTRTHVGAYVA